jgi:hypothetical protein
MRVFTPGPKARVGCYGEKYFKYPGRYGHLKSRYLG